MLNIYIPCLLAVLLKEKVFNPALPYQILLTLTLIVLFIFGVYFYRQIQSKRLHKRQSRQAVAKFQNNLVFNFAQNGSWTLHPPFIALSDDFQIDPLLDRTQIPLTLFRSWIKEESQQLLFDRYCNYGELALGQRFRIQLAFTPGHDYSWWEMSCLYIENGKLKGLLVNCDQQKQEEEQLMNAKLAKDSVNLKETVLANLNHDIRSPLSAVVGYSQLLTHNDLEISDVQQTDYARIIKTNASLLLKLLDDAVTTNTADLGTFKFYKRTVNVDQLFQETYETNHILIPSNLQFILQKGPEGLQLDIDLARVKQVLNNFLSNAVKFTEAGSITLGWELHDQEVECFVEDTGCGISPEQQEKIFDRYYTTDVEHRGLGLGLNICKAIVEQHQGRLAVVSQEEKGSRFSAFFPLQKGGNA